MKQTHLVLGVLVVLTNEAHEWATAGAGGLQTHELNGVGRVGGAAGPLAWLV